MCISPYLLIGMPQGSEWLWILIIVLLFWGNKVPGLARNLGTGINEFKAGLREGEKKPDAPPAKTESSDKKA